MLNDKFNREHKHISLAHGSGGKLMHNLIKNLFLPSFGNPLLSKLDDAAVFEVGGKKLAFSTDTYVVNPLFFPGGNIGKLAVCGTVNDLAVMGAKPLWLSCGMVIEEGFDYDILSKIITSMKKTALQAGVEIVTGDTKVVEKGKCDGVFINTSGVGIISGDPLDIENIQEGDAVIVNGSLGEHGIAVLSCRTGLGFTTRIESDCAPLNDFIDEILSNSDGIRFMRDPTRGGLATTLNEIVEARDYGILLNEKDIPVSDGVKGACELLGFDPLYIANEGKVVVVVEKEKANNVLEVMHKHKLGINSAVIGYISVKCKRKVCMKTVSGGTRIIDMLVGEQLPRIC